MNDTPDATDYGQLAQQLLHGLVAIERLHDPAVHNSTKGEMALLRTLMESEHELTPSQLAESSMVSSARVANILRALEEKGLVARTHSQADRRVVLVSLTEVGRASCQAKKRELDTWVMGYLRMLGPQDAESLVRIVRRTQDFLLSHRASGRPCPHAHGAAAPSGPAAQGGERA